MVILAGDHPKR